MLSRHRKGAHGGVRYITIVNRENAEVAKAFLELGMQIRHVKSMPPMSFGVSDREIGVTIEKVESGRMMQSLLMSNDQLYAQHFQAIFDELWKKGIDATERIKEIADGIEAADIEVIRNPKESLERAWKMAASPKDEVLLMFSTTRAFQRQLKMGGLAVLQGAIKSRAKIRILLPADEESKIMIAQIGDKLPEVEIRMMDKSLQTRITLLVVDKKECMLFELKDDSKRESHEAVGVSMYSNSKTIALSYASIFDSLWKQTELYEQLAAANEQLQVHDKMQKEFINIAAHELRTPIQPILAMSEILEGELGGESESVKMIVRNARRLEQLTRNILDASKIEGQSLKLDVKRISLNDVILNTLEDHGDRIAASNSSVRLLYQPVDIFIEADRERVTQVISNILGNALKFTDSGEIAITAQKNENDDNIIVSIRDTGSGIDSEIMPRLFSKFATKSDKGTGLGLFISKSIVEAHGGMIWAENNRDGKGATFTFSLPSVQRR
jgi:two-component system, OmpR family, sensor histidine kinase VicK